MPGVRPLMLMDDRPVLRLILRSAPPGNAPVGCCCARWDGKGLFGLTERPENWLGGARPVGFEVGMARGCVVAGDAYCSGRDEFAAGACSCARSLKIGFGFDDSGWGGCVAGLCCWAWLLTGAETGCDTERICDCARSESTVLDALIGVVDGRDGTEGAVAVLDVDGAEVEAEGGKVCDRAGPAARRSDADREGPSRAAT